jgi:hypothetical protein
MDCLHTDQYTHVTRDCPVNVDLHPADDTVEITLGEGRTGGNTLRLLLDHPDACVRLMAAVDEARIKLIGHTN